MTKIPIPSKKLNHHDIFFKEGFSSPPLAKEIFQLVLTPEEFAAFDWGSMRAAKDTFLNQRADLVFTVDFKDKQGEKAQFCMLLEHKSQYSYKIFAQTLKYQASIITKSFEETGKAWPVIVVVFYHGKKPWKWAKTFQEGLFREIYSKIPSTLRKDMLNFRIRLLDIHDPRFEKILKDKNFKTRGFLNGLKEIWFVKAEEEDLKDFIFHFDNWTGAAEDLLVIVGNYLFSLVPGITKELWEKVERAAIRRGIFPKGRSYMLTRESIREEGREEGLQKGMETGLKKGMLKGREEGLQKGMETGLQKGMETGLKKGRLKGRKEVMLNMLQAKMDISIISKATRFSKEEIKKFAKGRPTPKPDRS